MNGQAAYLALDPEVNGERMPTRHIRNMRWPAMT